ncbi:MAG TPA: hypothetical protein VII72_13870 [Myxococcota bacterium]|jgi:hypothetical protein
MVLGRNMAVTRSAAWLARVATSARTLARPRILRQGVAAARRGNLEAAFALLREEVTARPDHPRSTLLFWELALACERAREAALPMARLVRSEAAAGRCEKAADHWLALVGEVPEAVVDVAVLMRILPVLRDRVGASRGAEAQKQARAQLIDALRRSVDPNSGTLTPALALRLVEEARGLDLDVARRAAQAALASPDLHEAKRVRLQQLLESLEAGAWPEPPPPAPLPTPQTEGRAAPLPERELEASAARIAARMPPPGALRVSEVIPVELDDQGLVAHEGEDDRRTRIDYRAIEAVAAAEVAEVGDAPVLVVDLVLRAPRAGRPRSILRMRSNAFDPASLFPDRTDAGQALRALLAELLDRSAALPLPDPDSALGVRPQRFATLADFEEAVKSRLSD